MSFKTVSYNPYITKKIKNGLDCGLNPAAMTEVAVSLSFTGTSTTNDRDTGEVTPQVTPQVTP